MVGLNDDLTRKVAENAVGGAVRVEDIEGVGPKTRRQLRNKGFRDVQDIKSASPSELKRVPGVGEQTAKKMIKSAGGDARSNSRSSTGSVSAAGIRSPVGDFKVELGDKDKADASFGSSLSRGIGRSQEAAQADKGKRAPVTTDFDEWDDNKGTLDFPGVDTPSEDPEFMEMDRRFNSGDDLISDAEDEFF